MKDIVERLCAGEDNDRTLALEAATLIMSLRTENDQLRKLLSRKRDIKYDDPLC